MLSARCPSCGAPVHFAHAVAVATVCESCRSTVVRTDDHLETAGRASVFPRDLSPIVLGARGQLRGRPFSVAGVLRKRREGARWNEWFLVFDDGEPGWLGESNGHLQVYDRHKTVRDPGEVRAGSTVVIDKRAWQVIEADTAWVVAAEGELPAAYVDDTPTPYVDLRGGDGKSAATIDGSTEPATLYLGQMVSLKDLKLDRIRPFAGWTDPDLKAAMAGPEITNTRSLACPNCRAPLALKAAEALSLVCKYCSSVIAIEDAAPRGVVDHLVGGDPKWAPAIPLGSRGTLDGIEWEVIGAMQRYVVYEGVHYGWVEHFLWNPYHGYRWLIEDLGTNRWNLAERLPDLPTRKSTRSATHGGHSYRAFQVGRAHVSRVMGEFTWEVRQGDEAETIDYVDPPWMLSVETERNEQIASLARYVPSEEVQRAFPKASVDSPSGIAPNQPNPFDARGTTLGFGAGALGFTLGALALFCGQLGWSANETVTTFETHLGAGTTVVDVSPPFVVPNALRTTLTFDLTSTLDPEHAVVHLTALHQEGGTAYHVNAGRVSGQGTLSRPPAGTYLLLVEAAGDSDVALTGKTVRVKVVRDPPLLWPVLVVFLIVFLGPAWWFLGRTSFEGRRWQNSDFAG